VINNQQGILNTNESSSPPQVPATNAQPSINHLQQSVSDVSTLSSTTNSDS